MGLADDIRTLRDRALAELAAAHDYFSHSESAWSLVRNAGGVNATLDFRNPVTGTSTTGPALADLARDYAARHITEATFQQFLSIFEVFIGDLLRLWLTAGTRSIGGKTDALDAGDLPTVVAQLVDHEIAEVTYKSPRKVFEYLERRIGFAPPPATELDQLAEAKASRDVLIHNRGLVDAAYRTKAGALARDPAGQPIDIPKPYHRAVWEGPVNREKVHMAESKGKPKRDPEREERIENDIIVDCYNETERASGWYCYLGDQLQFPFTARCVAKRRSSPLRVGDEVEVTGMAPDEECEREMFVMIRWEKDGLAVPLAQLLPVRADEETTQAVEDWHYWVGQGYEF